MQQILSQIEILSICIIIPKRLFIWFCLRRESRTGHGKVCFDCFENVKHEFESILFKKIPYLCYKSLAFVPENPKSSS